MLPLRILVLTSLCISTQADNLGLDNSNLLDNPHLLRGASARNVSGLPWATQRLLEKGLEAIASSDKISFSDVSYSVQTPSDGGLHDSGLFHKIAGPTFGEEWQDKILAVSSAFSEAVAGSLKTAFTSNLSSHAFGNSTAQSVASERFDRHSLKYKPGVRSPAPGVVAVVYEEFFNKGSAVAVKLLKENFRKVHLKTAAAIAHIPVIGDFDIKLENVKLTSLELDNSSTGVSLGQDGTFVFIVERLAAVVEGHFQWRRTKFPFISGGCQTRVTAKDGNIQLRVSILEDKDGRPQIGGIQAPQLSFGTIEIVTSEAKLAWLYNAIASLAHDQIQAAIVREVSKQVNSLDVHQTQQYAIASTLLNSM